MIDNIYLNIVGPGHLKFVYLSIKIPLQKVDVNIHPTKKLVSFICQEEIESHIAEVFREVLENSVYIVDNSVINHAKSGKLCSNDTKVEPTRSRTDFHQSSIKTFLPLQTTQFTSSNSHMKQFIKQNASSSLDVFKCQTQDICHQRCKQLNIANFALKIPARQLKFLTN